MESRKATRLLNALTVVMIVALAASVWLTHSRSGQASATPAAAATAPDLTYNEDQDVGRLYFSLAMLPQESRKAYYGQFSAKQKRAVWLLHVTMTQLNLPSATPAQQAVFQKIALFLHKANFDDLTKNDALLGEARAIQAAAEEAFGQSNATALLTQLGGAVKFRSAYGQRAGFDGACECNDYWNYCGDRRHCDKGGDNCTEASSGCGFLWLWACNGVCKDDIAP